MLPDPLHLGRTFAQYQNLGEADSWGGETELAFENKTGKLSGWYGYDMIQGSGVQGFFPSPHKFGATGRLYLPHGITLNANYVFSSFAHGTTDYLDIASRNRLDLTVSKELGKNAELMLGVSDVLNATDYSVLSGSKRIKFDTPGRTFFARFQIKF